MAKIARILLLVFFPSVAAAVTAVMATFGSGEITPRLWGRTDSQQFYSGCRVLENMQVKPLGPVQKRPGTKYVADAAGQGRLIPFVFSTDVTFVLELTDETIRFYK